MYQRPEKARRHYLLRRTTLHRGFAFAEEFCFGSRKQRRRRGRQVGGLPDCFWQDYRNVRRAPFPLCLTRTALEQLLRTVGSERPETGAKGFGPKDRVGLDVVEFDVLGSAYAHGAMYAPDVHWAERVREHHLDQPDERMRLWTADIHSHPGNMGWPSSRVGPGLGDLGYAERVFEENEWMEWFLIPILTGTATGEVVLHPWVVHRSDPQEPMLADGVEIRSADQFPERSFNPVWLRAQEEPEPPPFLVHHRAHRPLVERRALALEYTQRLENLVSREFRRAHVMVVGLGAGSHMVEKLARLCPGTLTICDLDVVEIHNLSRTVYTADDALQNRPKAEAMAQRLLEINPLLDVRSCHRDITSLTAEQLDELFEGVDLVVAGTDRFEAQALLNEQAVARGIHAVFIGLYPYGEGGRVVGYVPGETGCYRCAAKERYRLFAEDGQAGLDADGAPGTIMDGQLVDMVASKLLVGMLERGQVSHAAGFLDGCDCRTDIIVRCDPRFDFVRALWDGALGDLPEDQSGQLHSTMLYSHDTLWLANPPDPACPCCGVPERVAPPVEEPDRLSSSEERGLDLALRLQLPEG